MKEFSITLCKFLIFKVPHFERIHESIICHPFETVSFKIRSLFESGGRGVHLKERICFYCLPYSVRTQDRLSKNHLISLKHTHTHTHTHNDNNN